MTDLRLDKIQTLLESINSPPFRLGQVRHALYEEGVEYYSQISTVPKSMRQLLSETLGDRVLSLTNIFEATGGQAQKILFETQSKQRIETVRMLFRPTKERDTLHTSLCISSQSGCALACKFCSTGAIGFKKNLTADEICDQVLYFLQKKHPVDSVSFMGMGEPFANPNIWDSLKILTSKDTLGISRHKISISTVGLIPGIEKLITDFPQINLAFSLHSPFNDQRSELMPINKIYPIEDVMAFVQRYVLATNNKVFIAYALMEGINDSSEHAKALIKLIKNQGIKSYLYHINLIRFNPGPGTEEFKKPKSEAINSFMQLLKDGGLSVTLRQSFGVNIYAACGQLYGKYLNK